MAESGMKTILTLGLVGVGAYFLYEYLIAPNLVAAVPTPTPGTTPASTGQPTTVSTAPSSTPATTGTPQPITAQSTPAQMQAKMLAAGDDPTTNHSVSQWNYYYAQVAGIAGPDSAVVLPNSPDPVNQLIPFSTWWAGMQKAGFSGLGAFARFNVPFVRQPPANMTFAAGHPLPYAPNYTLFHGLHGLGAAVHTTGMEAALWAGRGLNRHWNRGW
jgi:hypothetical protein